MPGHLTPERKASVLADFAAERAKPGLVDPEVLPLCDAVNALPGLVTTFSCSGHFGQPFPDGFGYLTLWPSRSWDAALEAALPEIAARFKRPIPPKRMADGRWAVSFPGLGAFSRKWGPEPGRRARARSTHEHLAFVRGRADPGAGGGT